MCVYVCILFSIVACIYEKAAPIVVTDEELVEVVMIVTANDDEHKQRATTYTAEKVHS